MQSSHQTILILSESYYQTRVNTFFQSSYQTLLTPWGSNSQTILNTFQDIKQYWNFQRVTVKQYNTPFSELTSNNTDISRELLANNTTHFSRAYIKPYWHLQRATGKQYYTLFQSLYQAILTFSESSFQINL